MPNNPLSSPLTMALLGGGMGGGGGPYSPVGMAMYDPALLGAMQRIGLGQGMLNEGMSAAPAYPMQALSRLGQSLLGSLMLKRAYGDLGNVGAQQAAAADQAHQAIMGTGGDVGPQSTAAPSTSPAASAALGTPIASAIRGQEGSGPNAVSVQGAGGVYQVTKPLFKQFANEGEDWNNENDRQAVAGRALYAYNQKFGGDPSRVATAWFSGENNVAPPGSPTPYIKDTHDANGVYTSDYVRGVLSRLPQGQQFAQAGNISTDMTGSGASGTSAAPQVGMANPNVRQLLSQMQTARTIMAAHPYPMDPVRLRAQADLETLQQQLSIGQWQRLPDGSSVNTTTGQVTYAPTGRGVQIPGVGVGIVGPGGNLVNVLPQSTEGIAAAASAKGQGTTTGTQTAQLAGRMFDLGREADTTLGNIDYGINALHQAAAAGLPSGYFAPWEAHAVAAAKNLGIDTDALGIKPSATGDIQTAQKTLGVVAGQILQNTIGKDSQITDAKIQHFIHTQPDISLDPNALERILNWARTQFVYNRDMAMDAMHNMDPQTGLLPPGWRASYVTRKGAFAPIYDPLSQEMAQPKGEGPAAEAPKAPAPVTPPPAPPQYQEGQTATNPTNGKRLVFKSGQWQPLP